MGSLGGDAALGLAHLVDQHKQQLLLLLRLVAEQVKNHIQNLGLDASLRLAQQALREGGVTNVCGHAK